jgi:nickel transport system permease protein
MTRFVLGRMASLIPILAGISVVTFLLLRLDPVDPAVAYLRMAQVPPTDEAVAVARQELGLDRPLPVQYWDWLKQSARLDFGRSTLTRRPVLEDLFY